MDKLKYIRLKNEDGSYTDSIPLAVDSDYVDINGDTLTNKINTLATKTEVQALASGSPAGVYESITTLTEADPDHSKIYIVSANGHWYYYNNGWQDGGIYQSSGIADKDVSFNSLSDTLFDVLSLEKRKEDSNTWESGSIASATGQWVSSTTRIRTKYTYVFGSSEIRLIVPEGYKYDIYEYDNKTEISNHYIGHKGWLNGENKIIIDTSHFYRLVLSYIDNTDIEVDESSKLEIYDYYNKNFEYINETKEELLERIENIENKEVSFDNLSNDLFNILSLKEKNVNVIEWIIGSIASATGQYLTSSNRIRTNKTFAFNNSEILLKCPEGYKYAYFEYDDPTLIEDHFISTSGWLQGDKKIIINTSYYYRFLLSYIDNTDIEADESSKLEIYDYYNENTEETQKFNTEYPKKIKANNKYNTPKMVQHRGMTCLRSENTLPAYYMCSEYGIQYAKVDVQVTKDGYFVCSHQEKMQSPFVTPGDNNKICDLTLDEIENNYYISGPMYDALYNQKLNMPTIDEAFTCFRETGLIPMIDMKTGTNYKDLYDKICEYGLQHTAYILTSRKSVLTAFRELDPDMSLILWNEVSDSNYEFLIGLGGSIGFFTDSAQITKEVVEKYHNAGIFFGTYPINNYTEMERVVRCGVDFIQTDSCQRDLKTNFSCKNLYWTASGSTNYTLELADNQFLLFNDYISLQAEVYYSDAAHPVTISIDGAELIDNDQPGKWHKIKMDRIRLRHGNTSSVTISCDDPEFQYLDLIIRQYNRVTNGYN